MSLVLSRRDGHVVTLTMNRPERRNALSEALIDELVAGFHAAQRDKARVVVLRASEGAKVWSAGHDVHELPVPGRDPLGYEDSIIRLLRVLQELSLPVIAMIDGGVYGGACDVALSCDILVGSPAAKFVMSPARMGVPYNVSGLLRFVRVLGVHVAKEMLFTAQPVVAERALDVGLLSHLVPAGELEAFTYDLAGKIAANSPLSICVAKQAINLLAAASSLSPATYEKIESLRRKVYESDDYREGIQAFLEKRAPNFEGD